MKRIKLLLAALSLACGLGLAALPLAAHADTPKSVVCSTLDAGTDCAASNGNSVDINNIIKVIINILSLVVGIVAVIMIIVAGLKYVTSNGDSNNITSAKNTLIYALIGLAIVALAQFIVQFVLNKVTSTTKKTSFVTSQAQQFATVDNRYYVLK